jgi:hypothetical protein
MRALGQILEEVESGLARVSVVGCLAFQAFDIIDIINNH